jgi:3-oxoacyl-[acyl-carrier-protein] synthase III
MLTIAHTAVHLPPRVACDAVQATERNLGYGHMIAPTASFALPRGRGRIDAAEAARLARSAPVMLPVAPAGRSLSDLALDAVNALGARADAQAFSETTHIVVAHASLNQQIVESVAGRVQCVLGLEDALPLALGQCGTLGLYAALPLAQGLLRDGGQMLLVAADKWLYPFFRVYGNLVAYGDGAGALLLRHELRHDAAGRGARVLGSALACGSVIDDPWSVDPRELEQRLLAQAAQAATDALADAGVRAAQIGCFAPGGFGASFRSALGVALGIDSGRLLARGEVAHLSSADTLASLDAAQAALAPGERRLALFCDAALAGMAGALVVELHGAPRAPLH